jgi:hypothetical protein
MQFAVEPAKKIITPVQPDEAAEMGHQQMVQNSSPNLEEKDP